MKQVTISGNVTRYVRKILRALRNFGVVQRIERELIEIDDDSVIDEALEQLPPHYIIQKEYFCFNRSIDYIVIGPTGIFVIGVMFHRGTVERMGEDHLLLNNRRPQKDFIRLMKEKMSELQTLLKEQTGGDWRLQPILCFTRAYIKTRGEISGVPVIPVTELVQKIKLQPVILDRYDVMRVAGCLKGDNSVSQSR